MLMWRGIRTAPEKGKTMGLRVSHIIATVLAALAATPAGAQVLWQNVQAGMTTAEIQRAQPRAVVVTGHKQTLKDGWATCELSLDTYEVQGNDFSVCFFMREGKLVQVMMKANEPSIVVFRSIGDLLRAKYGQELSPAADPCRRVGSMTLCELKWLLPSGVNVSSIYIDIGGRSPLLNVNYQTTMREESNKL
jgi:hypothetical protein